MSTFVDNFDGSVISAFWYDTAGCSVSGGRLGMGSSGHATGKTFPGGLILTTQSDVHTADDYTDSNLMTMAIGGSGHSIGMMHYAYRDSPDKGGAKHRWTKVFVDGPEVYSANCTNNIYFKIVFTPTQKAVCWCGYDGVVWGNNAPYFTNGLPIYTQNWSSDFIPNAVTLSGFSDAPASSYFYDFSMISSGGNVVLF